MVCLPLAYAEAGDQGQIRRQGPPIPGEGRRIPEKDRHLAPEINLLDAARDGLITVEAQGRGDGRMTLSVTNRTRKALRVVLPPGIIAQGATGQFGGMGGMGGGMGGMGGGMGGMGGGMGGMGGGMGGMGGGMGGMGGGGGMGGMGGMGRKLADHARHDGHDDAGPNHHVLLRRPR